MVYRAVHRDRFLRSRKQCRARSIVMAQLEASSSPENALRQVTAMSFPSLEQSSGGGTRGYHCQPQLGDTTSPTRCRLCAQSIREFPRLKVGLPYTSRPDSSEQVFAVRVRCYARSFQYGEPAYMPSHLPVTTGGLLTFVGASTTSDILRGIATYTR